MNKKKEKNMNKVLLLLAAIFVMTSSFQCGKENRCLEGTGHSTLTLENNSDLKIYYSFYWNYPDTVIGQYNPALHNIKIMPGERKSIYYDALNQCWEYHFLDNKKEWIYLFDADTIESLDWDIVRDTERGLLERREIDLNYLKQNDFRITFP